MHPIRNAFIRPRDCGVPSCSTSLRDLAPHFRPAARLALLALLARVLIIDSKAAAPVSVAAKLPASQPAASLSVNQPTRLLQKTPPFLVPTRHAVNCHARQLYYLLVSLVGRTISGESVPSSYHARQDSLSLWRRQVCSPCVFIGS